MHLKTILIIRRQFSEGKKGIFTHSLCNTDDIITFSSVRLMVSSLYFSEMPLWSVTPLTKSDLDNCH